MKTEDFANFIMKPAAKNNLAVLAAVGKVERNKGVIKYSLIAPINDPVTTETLLKKLNEHIENQSCTIPIIIKNV